MHLALYALAGDLNPGPHKHLPSTLPIESPSQSHRSVLSLLRVNILSLLTEESATAFLLFKSSLGEFHDLLLLCLK